MINLLGAALIGWGLAEDRPLAIALGAFLLLKGRGLAKAAGLAAGAPASSGRASSSTFNPFARSAGGIYTYLQTPRPQVRPSPGNTDTIGGGLL